MTTNNAVRLIIVCMLVSGWLTGATTLSAKSPFDIDIEIQTIYDDNILNYSDSDLDQMDDPGAPDNKFAVESKDDVIINPEIDIVYKTKLLKHSFHLGFKTDYYYYNENDVKRHWRFETYFKRYFKRGTFFQGSVSYLPDYYYRNSFITGDGYHEAKFDKISLNARMVYRLFKSTSVSVNYTYSDKDFIEIFDERDIYEHEVGGTLVYRPVKLWKGWIGYEYSHAVGAGADNSSHTRDTSYDGNKFTLGSRFYLKGLGRKSFQIAGKVSYELVQFQTMKITDIYRLGREDTRLYFYGMLKHYLKRGISVEAIFKSYDKSVEIPADYLIDQLESSSNTFYLVFNYSL